jgi:uncharacterized membrane protein YoaT (DUF817 family)
MRGYWDGEINDVTSIILLQIVGRSFNIDKYRWHCWVASEMTITESIHNIFKLWLADSVSIFIIQRVTSLGVQLRRWFPKKRIHTPE